MSVPSPVERPARQVQQLAERIAAVQARIGGLAAIRAQRHWESNEHDEYLRLRTNRSLLLRRYAAAERAFDAARQRTWTGSDTSGL
jgi:hypothetical protein